MIINNTVIHPHELVKLVSDSYRIDDVPEKTYRIKLDGKLIRINGKSEWLKIGSAKSAMKAAIRRNSYALRQMVNGSNPHSINTYYITSEDVKKIYDELVNANLLEIVEMTHVV